MRIDNWPLDRIMRLPDWCFGRRWWIGNDITSGAGAAAYAFSTEELPDKFVVWGVLITCDCNNATEAPGITIRLGDHLPVNAADAMTMERLMKGLGERLLTYELFINPNGMTWINNQRLLIESSGRRLVYAMNPFSGNLTEVSVGVLISAMPKEVPDWLTSATAMGQS